MPTYEWHELSPLARFFFVRILPVFFLILGSAILYWVYNTFRDGAASHDWPTVQGLVTRPEVEDSIGDDKTDLTIEFKYRVDGKSYEESGAFFGTLWSDGQRRAVSRRYPAGQQVVVYYKPTDPGTAVLETGVRGVWIVRGLGLFGGVFVIAGLFFMVYLPGHARRKIQRAARGEFDADYHQL